MSPDDQKPEYSLNEDNMRLTFHHGNITMEVEYPDREVVISVTHPDRDVLTAYLPLKALEALMTAAGYFVEPPPPRLALEKWLKRQWGTVNTETAQRCCGTTKRATQKKLKSLAARGFRNDLGQVLVREKGENTSTFRFVKMEEP